MTDLSSFACSESGLLYELRGTVQPVVVVALQPGQGVRCDAGGLSWMEDTVRMSTATGGLLRGLSRKLSGGTLFMNEFSTDSQGVVAFSADFPGRVLDYDLEDGQALVMHRHAFVAAETSVTLTTTFTRRLGAGMFGGDGFVLQRVSGPGMVFAEVDGDCVEYDLLPGRSMLVEPGHVAMFQDTVDFGLQLQRGLKNMLLSGDGAFLAKLTGPGRVWLNSMSASKVALRVSEYLPKGG